MTTDLVRLERRAGALVPAPDPLSDALAGWLLSHSDNTRGAYLHDLQELRAWLGGLPNPANLEDATRAHIDAWARHLEQLGRKPSTIARKLASVASFYRYAHLEQYLPNDPTVNVRRPRVDDDSTTVALSRAEVQAILERADERPRDRAVFALLAFNGLRVSEVVQAQVEDLGEERGHRTLRITRKGGKSRLVPLAPVTARALDEYLGARTTGPMFINKHGEPISRHSVKHRVALLGRQATGKRVTPHTLRHAFVTLSLDAGAPLRDVQDAAGHADPRTTRRYDRSRGNLDRHPTYALAALLG